jgi:hypothetical protein
MAEKQLKTTDELKASSCKRFERTPIAAAFKPWKLSRCPNNLRSVPIGALICGPWWASRVLHHPHVTSNGIFRADLHSHRNRPQATEGG